MVELGPKGLDEKIVRGTVGRMIISSVFESAFFFAAFFEGEYMLLISSDHDWRPRERNCRKSEDIELR